MKIISNRDKIVGMKSMFASALLSSQRPKTLFAAANTAHLELRVVVMPAWNEPKRLWNSVPEYRKIKKTCKMKEKNI